MRRVVYLVALGMLPGLMATLLTSCGQSDSPKPVKIQGELISTAKTTPPQPGETAVQKPGVTGTPVSISGEYPPVGFDKLSSYNFQIPNDQPVTNQPAGPDKLDEQIPASVKAFNQKKVSIKGYMLPLKLDGGTVTEFLILKDQSMCCYGNVPKITEWITVKTRGKGVKPIMDQPVSIFGTLHVGAVRENGYLVGIYQLDGDKLVEPDRN